MTLSIRLKQSLIGVGRRIDGRHLARARSALGYLEIGALAEERNPGTPLAFVPDRFGVFECAVERITGSAPLYLEFGVYAGETTRWWAERLRRPGARFVGFDSFDGLPESWRPGFDEGEFATDGPPQIDDPRVAFVVGWFSDTLPHFTIPEHDQLIVNVDSDLYSSAKTVLTWAVPHLRPGSLLYFDELADRDHELRALRELLTETDLDLRPVTAGGGGAHFLFEVH